MMPYVTNPKEKNDWRPGDTAYFYNAKSRNVIPVTIPQVPVT